MKFHVKTNIKHKFVWIYGVTHAGHLFRLEGNSAVVAVNAEAEIKTSDWSEDAIATIVKKHFRQATEVEVKPSYIPPTGEDKV